MKNKKLIWVIAVLLIAIVGIGLYIYLQKIDVVEVFKHRFFDKEGNEIIGGTLSIVGGVEGIYSMETTVTITNTGEKNGTFNIDLTKSTPSLWVNGFTNNCDKTILKNGVTQTCKLATSKTLLSGQSGSWTSALVKTAPFESTSSTLFTIYIDGVFVVGGQTQRVSKSATDSVLIKPDPSIDFTVDIIIN